MEMNAVGHVYDSTDQTPLVGVNIVVKTPSGGITQMGTTTDERGFFNLQNIPAGHVVEFRYIGYRTSVPLLRDFPATNNVTMQRDAVNVPEATVTANRPASGKQGWELLAWSVIIIAMVLLAWHFIQKL